ncbi:hypothetical protein POM88_015077 [Heracleum sosnowskyi]|uniref:Serine/threonine specific protein phosphatases domain-containing protein n=1 Tax=Heracleum sosnowskyi TaxID=360622 RepID=A0AAD8MVS7_9APIA|nr:hypothetical protein POM88_015077 [Heracleum sosnowskyi]
MDLTSDQPILDEKYNYHPAFDEGFNSQEAKDSVAFTIMRRLRQCWHNMNWAFSSLPLMLGLVGVEQLLGFAELFTDELILNNVSRHWLVNMCKYMGIPPLGTDEFLRFVLQERLECYIDYLFLGDYVDRGQHNLETITLLLPLKASFSSDKSRTWFRFAVLHHLMGENDVIWAWTRFNQLFNYVPLTALIEKKIICMHGGIRRFDPIENDSVEGLRPNARGPGLVTFGYHNLLWNLICQTSTTGILCSIDKIFVEV